MFGFGWVGGLVLGNQAFGFPVEKKYVHPEMLFLFMISLNLYYFSINYFLMYCSEI